MQTNEQTNKNRSRVVVIATHSVVKLPTKATSSTLCEYTVSIYRRLLYCNAIVCLTLVCASLVQITGVCRTNVFLASQRYTDLTSLPCAIILEDLSLKYQFFLFTSTFISECYSYSNK